MADAKQRDEWNRTGSVCAVVLNAARSSSRSKTWKPSDFIPEYLKNETPATISAKDLHLFFGNLPQRPA